MLGSPRMPDRLIYCSKSQRKQLTAIQLGDPVVNTPCRVPAKSVVASRDQKHVSYPDRRENGQRMETPYDARTGRTDCIKRKPGLKQGTSYRPPFSLAAGEE